jgi:hypothetical protein
MPSSELDELARFKLARDKKDVFRLLPRPGTLRPLLFFLDGVSLGEFVPGRGWA